MNSFKKDEQVKLSDYELHLLAGLMACGYDDEHEQQWMGTSAEWRKYEELLLSELSK